ncbi:unnamed protein product [Meloidogyne enterolobii]|uniref:Uncharacterized protein n=1 Tax=Meloidogyne enterolobii TaxID=390850 RepID=A0ACB1B7L1_MELEN
MGLTNFLFPINIFALREGIPSNSIIFPKVQEFLGCPSCCTTTTSPIAGSLFIDVRGFWCVHPDFSRKTNKYSFDHLFQNRSNAFLRVLHFSLSWSAPLNLPVLYSSSKSSVSSIKCVLLSILGIMKSTGLRTENPSLSVDT